MSLLKKIGKKITSAPKSILGGAVSAAGAAGAQTSTIVRRGANILSGVATGNTEKITSNISALGKDSLQNYRAGIGSTLQAQSAGLITSNTPNATQLEKQKLAEQARMEEAALAADEAARPGIERKLLAQQQYQNLLLKGGGRNYNTLLGGGY